MAHCTSKPPMPCLSMRVRCYRDRRRLHREFQPPLALRRQQTHRWGPWRPSACPYPRGHPRRPPSPPFLPGYAAAAAERCAMRAMSRPAKRLLLIDLVTLQAPSQSATGLLPWWRQRLGALRDRTPMLTLRWPTDEMEPRSLSQRRSNRRPGSLLQSPRARAYLERRRAKVDCEWLRARGRSGWRLTLMARP